MFGSYGSAGWAFLLPDPYGVPVPDDAYLYPYPTRTKIIIRPDPTCRYTRTRVAYP